MQKLRMGDPKFNKLKFLLLLRFYSSHFNSRGVKWATNLPAQRRVLFSGTLCFFRDDYGGPVTWLPAQCLHSWVSLRGSRPSPWTRKSSRTTTKMTEDDACTQRKTDKIVKFMKEISSSRALTFAMWKNLSPEEFSKIKMFNLDLKNLKSKPYYFQL